MAWNSESAAKILDKCKNAYFITPDIKYTYRYQIRMSGKTLHIAVAKERVDGVVSAYINRRSISGEKFKDGMINGATEAKSYQIGHVGVTGDAGISSSVAKLETLNPKLNDVVLVHIDNPISFEKLVEWYSGLLSLNPPISEADDVKNSAKLTNSSSDKVATSTEDNAIVTGFENDPEKRKCIEQYAVQIAIKHYQNQGFSVTEKGKPYDLLCVKGTQIVHVEAKGTTKSANAIILTRNEVLDARDSSWRSDLFVVRDIELTYFDGVWEASGGENLTFEGWEPEEKDLTPIQYQYMLPYKL